MNPTEEVASSQVTENNILCMDGIKARADRVPVIILLGPRRAGKTSLIKNISGKIERSDDESEFGTTECEIAGTLLDGKEYFFIDTPGIDDDKNARTVLCQLTDIIAHIQHKAVFVGVWYVSNIRTKADDSLDAKFSNLLSEFCGEKFFPCIIFVTTHWDYDSSEELRSLEHQLRKRKECWVKFLNKGAITYENGKTDRQLTSESRQSALQDQIKRMVLRECRNPRAVVPQIVEETSQGVDFEKTTAASVVHIFKTSNSPGPNSESCSERLSKQRRNATSASSEQQASSNQTHEHDRQDFPKSQNDNATTNKSKNTDGFSDSNLNIDLEGVNFSTKGPGGMNINLGFRWPFEMFSRGKAPRTSRPGNLDPDVSLVDFCKSHGLPSDSASRAKMGEKEGITGIPGSEEFNIQLRNALHAKAANGGLRALISSIND